MDSANQVSEIAESNTRYEIQKNKFIAISKTDLMPAILLEETENAIMSLTPDAAVA